PNASIHGPAEADLEDSLADVPGCDGVLAGAADRFLALLSSSGKSPNVADQGRPESFKIPRFPPKIVERPHDGISIDNFATQRASSPAVKLHGRPTAGNPALPGGDRPAPPVGYVARTCAETG